MFIFNLKIDKNRIIKVCFVIASVVAIIFLIISSYKIFKKGNELHINDEVENKMYDVNNSNYTNILKAVHDNVNTYIGQRIHLSGYIYRVPDINEDEFIIARNMIISSNLQTLVVGFLCKCDNAKQYSDNAWVEIEAVINKGNYNGEIPILKIEKIKEIEKPNDEFVYPPDSDFLPTSVLY